jgi:hypothetical protein
MPVDGCALLGIEIGVFGSEPAGRGLAGTPDARRAPRSVLQYAGSRLCRPSGRRDIECAALEQILEVEPCELTFPRGNGDCGRAAHLCLTGVIVGRDRLLEPGEHGTERPHNLIGYHDHNIPD